MMSLELIPLIRPTPEEMRPMSRTSRISRQAESAGMDRPIPCGRARGERVAGRFFPNVPRLGWPTAAEIAAVLREPCAGARPCRKDQTSCPPLVDPCPRLSEHERASHERKSAPGDRWPPAIF